MQSDLLVKEKERGDLIGNDLGGMIVTVVHKGGNARLGGVGEAELGRADGVIFKSDTKHLGLEGYVDLGLVVGDGKDLVKRFLEAGARAETVGGDLLVSVGNPDVHNAGHAGLSREILGDLKAGLTVLYPELSRFLVGRGEGEIVLYLGVGEEGGVKVDTHIALFSELDPLCKMLGLKGISVSVLAILKNRVAGVEIELLLSGDEGEHLVHIRHKLLRCGCLTGIVTGGLNTAGECLLGIKANDVVALPTVYRHRNVLEDVHSLFGIYAVFCVIYLCAFVILHIILLYLSRGDPVSNYSALDALICILRLPIAVASMGRATTFLPVAFSVRSLR